MPDEKCSACGEPVVEGRLNCIKCGALYPDYTDRDLTWNPTEDEGEGRIGS